MYLLNFLLLSIHTTALHRYMNDGNVNMCDVCCKHWVREIWNAMRQYSTQNNSTLHIRRHAHGHWSLVVDHPNNWKRTFCLARDPGFTRLQSTHNIFCRKFDELQLRNVPKKRRKCWWMMINNVSWATTQIESRMANYFVSKIATDKQTKNRVRHRIVLLSFSLLPAASYWSTCS